MSKEQRDAFDRAGNPPFDAMRILAGWVLHLDHGHDCDCHGWEERRSMAEKVLAWLNKAIPDAPPPEPAEGKRWKCDGCDEEISLMAIIPVLAEDGVHSRYVHKSDGGWCGPVESSEGGEWRTNPKGAFMGEYRKGKKA